MAGSYFVLMANYNRLMNEQVYLAASALSAAELYENRGAFFGSIAGTLNHILVGDIIWLQRFAQVDHSVTALDYVKSLTRPSSLDAILFDDFNLLQQERTKIDEAIVEFVAQLPELVYQQALHYQNTKGNLFTKNFGHLLQHFFNHQTHHRGQVSTLLSQLGIDIGVTDLLMAIPDVEDLSTH